jgi:divalent metal cation (Fe/Co/Zn/Cd) transporter
VTTTTTTGLARRALGLGAFTITYNVIEGVIAVAAGVTAGAVSLLGFGLDSGIEVISAVIVVTRLAAEVRGAEPDERKEKVALRAVAVTFFLLAAYLVIAGIRDLLIGSKPETSIVGIVLTALSIVVMPTLAALKKRVGVQMGSALVIADAAETRLCALLSVTTFVALLAYLFLGWTWLDPVAGFVIAVFAVMEGREAWEGELVEDGERD